MEVVRDTLLKDFFLTRLSLREWMVGELALIWDKIAAKLNAHHPGVITGPWISRIKNKSTSNCIMQARKFLIKAGKFVTVSQLIQALKTLHKARQIKRLTDDANHYHPTNLSQLPNQPLVRDILRNQDKLLASLTLTLASSDNLYSFPAKLSQIQRLSGVITTQMMDSIAKAHKSNYMQRTTEFLRQIQDQVYGYEFVFGFQLMNYEETVSKILPLLPGVVNWVLQHPIDPAIAMTTHEFFNNRLKLHDDMKLEIASYEKNKVPGWRLLAKALKTYYSDRLQDDQIDAYLVHRTPYQITEHLYEDYYDWEDSTIDRLALCLNQIGLKEIAQRILADA